MMNMNIDKIVDGVSLACIIRNIIGSKWILRYVEYSSKDWGYEHEKCLRIVVQYVFQFCDVLDIKMSSKFNSVVLLYNWIRKTNTFPDFFTIIACVRLSCKFFEVDEYYFDEQLSRVEFKTMDGKVFNISNIIPQYSQREIQCFQELDFMVYTKHIHIIEIIENLLLALNWDVMNIPEIYLICDALLTDLCIKDHYFLLNPCSSTTNACVAFLCSVLLYLAEDLPDHKVFLITTKISLELSKVCDTDPYDIILRATNLLLSLNSL